MEIRGVLTAEDVRAIRARVQSAPHNRKTRLHYRAKRLEMTIRANLEKAQADRIDTTDHIFELAQIYAQVGRFDLLDQMAKPIVVDAVRREIQPRWERFKRFVLG